MPPTLESFASVPAPGPSPCPAPPPAGVQAKHEPAYEAITTEVAKLESPAGAGVRWDDVVQGAGELLKGTTKDLWLASYMAYGLYATRGAGRRGHRGRPHRRGDRAVLAGPLPRAEAPARPGHALGWFVERLGRMLPSVDQATVTAESLEALAVALKRLSQLSRERFADSAPAFGPLQDAIARLRAGAAPSPSPQLGPSGLRAVGRLDGSSLRRRPRRFRECGPPGARRERAASNGAAGNPRHAEAAAGAPRRGRATPANTVAPSRPRSRPPARRDFRARGGASPSHAAGLAGPVHRGRRHGLPAQRGHRAAERRRRRCATRASRTRCPTG